MPEEKYFGKYSGTVEDNRDADTIGKIMVSVPTIFPEEELMPARCALPYGLFFVPEKGQKVWVEFEAGESGAPIWTGIQYPEGERWPEEAQANPPDRRVIKTASGQVIILHDRPEERGIEIVSNGVVRIKSFGTIEIDAPNIIIKGRVVTSSPRPI
jgi:hypothetical protein